MAGCNTKAVGVSECREIESARCKASVPCGIIDEDEVEACVQFYDDHCLHGISGSDVPTADEQKTCLNLIEEAGETAKASLGMGGSTAELDEAACAVISSPWKHSECAYLADGDEEALGGGDAE
jgi:hypothetical protein